MYSQRKETILETNNMANSNSKANNLLHRKELKKIGAKVISAFGAPGNNRRSPKVYGNKKRREKPEPDIVVSLVS